MSDLIRVLGRQDLEAFLALVRRDPVVNVFADHRARTTQLDPRWLGGEVWGRFVDGHLVAGCHVAANMVPVGCDATSATMFAARALGGGVRSSTLVGPAEVVRLIWDEFAPVMGAPRDERWTQPHLVLDADPLVAPDPHVRLSRLSDLPSLFPACVAMYTEEVGVSPNENGGGPLYLARVQQLIGRRWSLARFAEDGEVMFKAEVASSSPHAAQVQGVWVNPRLRGQGLAAPAMAAVVAHVRAHIAPVVSLYVNDFNTPARATYERVGFRQTDVFATVMF